MAPPPGMRAPEPRRWDPNRSIIDTFRPDEHHFMEQLLILFSAAFLHSIVRDAAVWCVFGRRWCRSG